MVQGPVLSGPCTIFQYYILYFFFFYSRSVHILAVGTFCFPKKDDPVAILNKSSGMKHQNIAFDQRFGDTRASYYILFITLKREAVHE